MENWPKITKDTTIEELKEIHKRIWLYASEHGEKPMMTPYLCNCVLCEWTKLMSNSMTECNLCPAPRRKRVVGNGIAPDCCDGLFSLWSHMEDPRLKRKLALQIADLDLTDKRNLIG